MEMDRYANGVPSWLDLGSDDLDATKAFYTGLFGWELAEGPPEAGGYTLCLLGGRTVAGLGPKMGPGPTVWNQYVNVDDADATAAAAEAVGGSVMLAPFDVLAFGRMGFIVDPAGAVVGLWQPNEHLGAQLVNEPGSFCWSELQSRDLDAVLPFYQQVFGWTVGDVAEGPQRYVEFKSDGRAIAGSMPMPAEVPAEVPSYWGVYFAVADTDATIARATELGAALVFGPQDIPAGRFAALSDPQGAMFSVIALPAA